MRPLQDRPLQRDPLPGPCDSCVIQYMPCGLQFQEPHLSVSATCAGIVNGTTLRTLTRESRPWGWCLAVELVAGLGTQGVLGVFGCDLSVAPACKWNWTWSLGDKSCGKRSSLGPTQPTGASAARFRVQLLGAWGVFVLAVATRARPRSAQGDSVRLGEKHLSLSSPCTPHGFGWRKAVRQTQAAWVPILRSCAMPRLGLGGESPGARARARLAAFVDLGLPAPEIAARPHRPPPGPC